MRVRLQAIYNLQEQVKNFNRHLHKNDGFCFGHAIKLDLSQVSYLIECIRNRSIGPDFKNLTSQNKKVIGSKMDGVTASSPHHA